LKNIITGVEYGVNYGKHGENRIMDNIVNDILGFIEQYMVD